VPPGNVTRLECFGEGEDGSGVWVSGFGGKQSGNGEKKE
jgi:hypothetical protein